MKRYSAVHAVGAVLFGAVSVLFLINGVFSFGLLTAAITVGIAFTGFRDPLKAASVPSTSRRMSRGIVGTGMLLAAAGFWIGAVPSWVFYLGLGLILFGMTACSILQTVLIGFLVILLTGIGLFPLPIVSKGFGADAPSKPSAEEDDRLEDKRPEVDPSMTERVEIGRYGAVDMNRSGAVIGLDLAKGKPQERRLAARIYPTFREARRAAEEFSCPFLPSVDYLNAWGKDLDDRIIASVERISDRGNALFPGGKQGLLAAMLSETLQDAEKEGGAEAAAILAAAISLGGEGPVAPEQVLARAEALKREFLAQGLWSKPLGIYAEQEDLGRIFRRSRFLRLPLPEGAVIRLAGVLERRKDLSDAYRRFRRLDTVLHNPEEGSDLLDFAGNGKEVARKPVAFWPFSDSPENRLFNRMYAGRPELPDENVMEVFRDAIRVGKVSLAPSSDSGWYDHQLYSLETLLLPEKAEESAKLLLHAPYKRRLCRAFESMMTKHRETHIEAMAMTLCASIRMVPPSPDLQVEPCATHYLRAARAYRFLGGALEEALGTEAMRGARLEKGESLAEEIDRAAALFSGLYLVSADDIGMRPSLPPEEAASLASVLGKVPDPEGMSGTGPYLKNGEETLRALWANARGWLSGPVGDFEARDQRVIVPVMADLHGNVRCWAVPGVQLLKIKAWYARPPEASGVRRWEPAERVIAVNAFEELTLQGDPPTREEFRALCSRHTSLEELRKALGKGGKLPLGLLIGAGALGIGAFALYRVRRPRNGA